MVAPPWVPVPPPAYGGIEAVVAVLCAGLAASGHDVTLVAAPGSEVAGVQVIAPLDELPPQIGLGEHEVAHALAAREELWDRDVILDHAGPIGALVACGSDAPVLHVTHGPLSGMSLGAYRAIARMEPELGFIALSRAQRDCAPDLPFRGICHNAIDMESVPFRPSSDGYLAFLGRITPEKGPAEAIEIARRAGRRLVMAAKCREPVERAHFAAVVEPHLGPDVEWLGEIGTAEKYELLAGAAGLVFPIAWPEPFGMVMIEAMACGTPVLATPWGSVPEVVVDGRTGFIREGIEELVRAAAELEYLDRRACREHVARRFSPQAMTAAYEGVISRVLSTQTATASAA